MNRSESFFIAQVEIHISNNYNVMGERAIVDGYKSKETRYAIHNHNGVDYLPASIYETYMRQDYPQVQSHIIKTRTYKYQLDKTYFRYYDDAVEVLNNVVTFYKWIQNLALSQKKKKDLNKVHAIVGHLLLQVTPYQSMLDLKQFQIGLPVKNRSELRPIVLSMVNERDLVPGTY